MNQGSVERDVVHSFHCRLSRIRSGTKTALEEVLSPKGRGLRRQTGPGIPAPRCSRRETPINRAGDYPAGKNGVKAILPPLTEGHAEHRGELTPPGPPLSLRTFRRLAWEVCTSAKLMSLGPLQSLHDSPDDITQVVFR